MANIEEKTLSHVVDQIDRAWRMEFDSPLDLRPVIKLLVHRARQRVQASNYSQAIDNPLRYRMDVMESDDSAFISYQAIVDKVLASSRALTFNGDGTLTLTMEHVLSLLESILDYRALFGDLMPWQYWPGENEPHISSGTGQEHSLLQMYSNRPDISWSRFPGNPGVVCGWGVDGTSSSGLAALRRYHDGPPGTPSEAWGAAARLMDDGSTGRIRLPWTMATNTDYVFEFDGPDKRIRCDGDPLLYEGAGLAGEGFYTIAVVDNRIYINGAYIRGENVRMTWCREYTDSWEYDMHIYGWNGSQAGDGHGFHVARFEFYKLDAEPSDAEADDIALQIHQNLTAHVDALSL
jgi:hypothetical protein